MLNPQIRQILAQNRKRLTVGVLKSKLPLIIIVARYKLHSE